MVRFVRDVMILLFVLLLMVVVYDHKHNNAVGVKIRDKAGKVFPISQALTKAIPAEIK